MIWYFTAQVLLSRSPSYFSNLGLAVTTVWGVHWSLKANGLLSKIPEWETTFKRKVLARASIWCMWQQYLLEETSIKWVLLFTMGMVQNICHFGYIVFLSCMFMALKYLTCTRKKYKIAKVKNILEYSHCKK